MCDYTRDLYPLECFLAGNVVLFPASSTLQYPIAVVAMILAAVLPYIYFRRKKWL